MKTLLLSLLFLSSGTQAARFVVEAKHDLSTKEMASAKNLKISAWPKINHPYFSKLYSVSGNVSSDDLKKLSWVKSVEETAELTKLSLEPSSNPDRLVQDELFPYQWYLLNQGQTYVREKDDIHNIPLVGVAGKDIAWKEIYKSIPAGRPVVAVLDSGVDLDHPDLKDNLWKNEKECGKDPSIDNDKNTLPGDCHGWNFTESINSDGAKSPQDMDGHGTHVAGLIAAAKNGSGLVGVNPNALIMPIKVMKDANSKSDVAASESFAQGIIYAVNMGAHVINLSLGWPRSLETKHLRDAVYYALSRNVVIVAAAGNNNSSEPLYPCAYDGVICAAASTLDGTYAGFTNFGGHVDAVTPGEGILSLSPVLFEPEFFSVPGYDIKSGTSQASPILAGMISILKAQRPDIQINEVLGRLYAAPKNADSKKYILGGVATWPTLAKEIETPVVRPVLKRVRQIVLNGENTNAKLVIPVRNYGLEAKDVQVKVESLSAGVEFSSDAQAIELLKTSEAKDLTFAVKITDLKAESNIKIKVTISGPEGDKVFFNEIPVSRDVRAEARFKKIDFDFVNGKLPVGNVSNGKIVSYLSTMEAYGPSKKHEFYLRKTVREEKKIEITLFKRENDRLVERENKIVINNLVTLVNFVRVDLNLDGKDDYLVQSVNEDEKGKFFEFNFFDENLNPLWSNFQGARVTLDLNVSSMNELSFIKMKHEVLGTILVPSFFTEGQLPKVDQAQDFFGRWDGSAELRLYYLEPKLDTKTLKIRSFMTHEWRDQIKKELNSKWYDTVLAENILPVSAEDAQKGQVRVIVSVGQSTKRQLFITTFNVISQSRGEVLPQIVLQTENIDPLFSVSANGLNQVGDAFLNVYDRSRAKVVTTKNASQASQLPYTHVSETDLIVGHIASFENGHNRFSILQTRDELVGLSTINGTVVKSSRPKLRYSFFSAKVLSEMYSPVVYNRNGNLAPALYVDSTNVTANRVYLFEEQQGKLVSSIKNSLIVPATCKALNPSYLESAKAHEFVFLCLDEKEKEWSVRTYEMK